VLTALADLESLLKDANVGGMAEISLSPYRPSSPPIPWSPLDNSAKPHFDVGVSGLAPQAIATCGIYKKYI
jgi:hypothetical protein